jgi:hypothetical protein
MLKGGTKARVTGRVGSSTSTNSSRSEGAWTEAAVGVLMECGGMLVCLCGVGRRRVGGSWRMRPKASKLAPGSKPSARHKAGRVNCACLGCVCGG